MYAIQHSSNWYILANVLSSVLEDSICKEYGFLEDAHLLWKVLKEKFATSQSTLLV
jgi:hypothetical protein